MALTMASPYNPPHQQDPALPSWLQRIGRRDQVGTAQLAILQDTYNRYRAQRETEIVAAAAMIQRASCEPQLACSKTRQGTPSLAQAQDSLSCPACEQVLSRCHDLKKHWRDHCRVQVHQYQCKNCEFQTHSKTYPKKMQSSRKEAANHELELIRILPPKTYGCPCCGAYLAGLKEMKAHVLKEHSHDFKQLSSPTDDGNVKRLRGLLQQPDILKELQYQVHASGCELRRFIGTLSWDGSTAKQFADRLQYGVRVEPNGGNNVGIAPQELTMCVAMIVAQARGIAHARSEPRHSELPAITQHRQVNTFTRSTELEGRLILEKDASCGDDRYSSLHDRHKRGLSTTSSDISEGYLRSRDGPLLSMDTLDFTVNDSPVSPMSTTIRPFHLLPPIQTTNLASSSKTRQIDSGYASDSAQPLDTIWSSIDSSSTASTLFTSASYVHTKPWDCEPNGVAELSAEHQFHELPATEFHELPAELFYTDDHSAAFDVKF